jgi:hypothetical protein
MWGIFSFCCGKDEDKNEDDKIIKSNRLDLEIRTPIIIKTNVEPNSPMSPELFNTKFIKKNRYEGE